jgi:hypothetical protein
MKHSSHDKMHPYLKGFIFWDTNRFWNESGLYSEKTRKEMDAMVDAMQKQERSLTKVDQSITHSKLHNK